MANNWRRRTSYLHPRTTPVSQRPRPIKRYDVTFRSLAPPRRFRGGQPGEGSYDGLVTISLPFVEWVTRPLDA